MGIQILGRSPPEYRDLRSPSEATAAWILSPSIPEPELIDVGGTEADAPRRIQRARSQRAVPVQCRRIARSHTAEERMNPPGNPFARAAPTSADSDAIVEPIQPSLQVVPIEFVLDPGGAYTLSPPLPSGHSRASGSEVPGVVPRMGRLVHDVNGTDGFATSLRRNDCERIAVLRAWAHARHTTAEHSTPEIPVDGQLAKAGHESSLSRPGDAQIVDGP